MKIALAVWNGRISPVFDVSRQVILLEIENGIITGNSGETFTDDDPLCRVCKLADLKVDMLICGAISRMLAGMLTAYKIRIIPFIAGELDDVIAAYLNNRLPNPLLLMPGCCRQRKQGYRGGRQQITVPETFGKKESSKIQKENTMPKGNQKGQCGGGGQGASQGKGCGGQGGGHGQGQGGQGSGQGGRGCGQGKGQGKSGSGTCQKQDTGKSPDGKNP